MPLSDIVDRLEPDVEQVTLVLSRQAVARVETARRRHATATSRVEEAEKAESGRMAKSQDLGVLRREADEAKADLDEAEAEAAKHQHTFHLRQLGNARWKELLLAVPPTDEQRQRVGRGLDHNPELFPIVALAFSLVDVDEDGQVSGPAVDQADLDRLDKALKDAGGHPEKAARAADEHMPDVMVRLNERLPSGGWERLTSTLYSLNMEVKQVPLS